MELPTAPASTVPSHFPKLPGQFQAAWRRPDEASAAEALLRRFLRRRGCSCAAQTIFAFGRFCSRAVLSLSELGSCKAQRVGTIRGLEFVGCDFAFAGAPKAQKTLLQRGLPKLPPSQEARVAEASGPLSSGCQFTNFFTSTAFTFVHHLFKLLETCRDMEYTAVPDNG